MVYIGDLQNFKKKLWHLELLHGSQWETHKICNIQCIDIS